MDAKTAPKTKSHDQNQNLKHLDQDKDFNSKKTQNNNKIDVNGKDTDPFYDFLKNERPGVMGTKNIKWNFSKFLVNKDGEVVKRYGPTTKPESIESDIIKLL